MSSRKSTTRLGPLVISACLSGLFSLSCLVFPPPAEASVRSATTIKSNTSLTNGLVGWWTFDGKDMINNIADVSGTGNTGDLIHPSRATTTVPGRLGQALSFNGSDDYVDVGSSATLTGLNTITVSFWFRSTQVWNANYWPGSATFVAKATAGSCSHDWTIVAGKKSSESGNAGRVIVGFGACSGSDVNLFSKTGKNDGKWHHAVFTRVPTTGGKLYIDAALEDSAGDDGSNIAASRPIQIGYDQNQGGSKLNGSIDDVRIYNRALGANEISRLYNLGATTHVSATIKSNTSLTNGLVGYWTFDGKDMINNVSDVSGNANTAYLNLGSSGNTATTSVPGRLGQSYSFDGVDDYAQIMNSSSVKPANISISMWIKPAKTFGGVFAYAADATPNNDDGYLFYFFSNSKLRWYLHNSSPGSWTFAEAPSVLSTGKWYHVVGTFDGSTMKLYVNNLLVATAAKSTAIDYSISSGLNPKFGRYWFSSFEYYKGAIDDVRMYNRALGANEVSRLYSLGATTHVSTTVKSNTALSGPGSGLVGWWTFDGKDMINNVADVSGNGNTGDLIHSTRATTTVPGRLGEALSFNGVDDIVDTPSQSLTNFTISAWAYKKATGQMTIMAQGNSGATDNTFYFRINGSMGFTTAPNTFVQMNTPDISLNKWHHVVGTYNGATMAFYLDGVLNTSSSKSGTPESLTNHAIIGRLGDYTGGQFWKGTLDDVRIYNRALGANEIKRLYDLGK